MNPKQNLVHLLEKGMSQEEAFSFFDQLQPITLDEMLGSWKGKEAPSHHPMDGLLTKFRWYGKKFISPEEVHPLVFEKQNGDLFYVNPSRLLQQPEQGTPLPEPEQLQAAETQESKARMRMVEYRGKLSAAMIYDQLPIIDIFRKVDDHTLFCVMDFKGPMHNLGFFFLLERA